MGFKLRFPPELEAYFESLLRYLSDFQNAYNFSKTRVFPHLVNGAGLLLPVAASPEVLHFNLLALGDR